MDTNVYLYSMDEYLKLQVQQAVHDRLIDFKENERWWFKPRKRGSPWVEKKYSDERILNVIDQVCLFEGFKFLVPLRGDIAGYYQVQLSSQTVGSRRGLAYTRELDEVGELVRPMRMPMKVATLDGFFQGFDRLKANRKHQNRRRG